MTPFGEELLHTIGYVYRMAGEKQLGRAAPLGLQGHLLSLRQKGHIVGNQATVLGSGISAWWSQREVAKEEDRRQKLKAARVAELVAAKAAARGAPPPPRPVGPGGQPPGVDVGAGEAASTKAEDPLEVKARAEDLAQAEAEVEAELQAAEAAASNLSGQEGEGNSDGGSAGEKSQANFMAKTLETLWHISVLDIEATLRQAAHKVLHDKSEGITKEHIAARARAMVIVGRIFEQTECEEMVGDDGAGPRKKRTWRDHLREQVSKGTGGAPAAGGGAAGGGTAGGSAAGGGHGTGAEAGK